MVSNYVIGVYAKLSHIQSERDAHMNIIFVACEKPHCLVRVENINYKVVT